MARRDRGGAWTWPSPCRPAERPRDSPRRPPDPPRSLPKGRSTRPTPRLQPVDCNAPSRRSRRSSSPSLAPLPLSAPKQRKTNAGAPCKPRLFDWQLHYIPTCTARRNAPARAPHPWEDRHRAVIVASSRSVSAACWPPRRLAGGRAPRSVRISCARMTVCGAGRGLVATRAGTCPEIQRSAPRDRGGRSSILRAGLGRALCPSTASAMSEAHRLPAPWRVCS